MSTTQFRRPRLASARGSALHTFLFVIATIGVSATAAIAIYKAYDEYVVKPRTPSEISRLKARNAVLEKENEALQSVREDLATRQRLSPDWKESEVVRQYVVDRTIAYAKALRALAEAKDRVAQGSAKPADLIAKFIDKPSLPTKLSESTELLNAQRRAIALTQALETIETLPAPNSGIVSGFTTEEIAFLKSQLPTTKLSLQEHERRLEIKQKESRMKETARRARAR